MKKVLILCDYFPPHSGPRMGYLVKYLSRLGWESYVVAGELSSRGGFEALTGFAKEVHIIPQKPHRKWNLLHILPFFWPYNYLHGEYDMLSEARKIVQVQRIDIVLSSCTFGFFPNNVARAVAKEFNIPLVADIRDLEEQNLKRSFLGKSFPAKLDSLRGKCSFISQARFRRGLRKADALVSVSPWHVQYLKMHYNKNTHLIYNGFDPETFKASDPIKTERFEIVYTGTMGTKDLRDYTYLLESVMRLDLAGVISPDKFKVKFYCGQIFGNSICEEVKIKGVEKYFEFLPFVPASEVPQILCAAAILLVLTNKGGYHGIMTTKFFEYLAVNRPVLCVTSDEESLEAAIRETNAGCAARSAEEAESFIAKLYGGWLQDGYTVGTVNGDRLEVYSRETQAEQFAELFEQVMKARRNGNGVAE